MLRFFLSRGRSASPSRTPSRSRTPPASLSRSPTISISPTQSPRQTQSTCPLAPIRLFQDILPGLCMCTQTSTWELCPTTQTRFRRCAAGWSNGLISRYADPTSPLTYLGYSAQTYAVNRSA
eukprot:g24405.t1